MHSVKGCLHICDSMRDSEVAQSVCGKFALAYRLSQGNIDHADAAGMQHNPSACKLKVRVITPTGRTQKMQGVICPDNLCGLLWADGGAMYYRFSRSARISQGRPDMILDHPRQDGNPAGLCQGYLHLMKGATDHLCEHLRLYQSSHFSSHPNSRILTITTEELSCGTIGDERAQRSQGMKPRTMHHLAGMVMAL